jgi:hypothetical protein
VDATNVQVTDNLPPGMSFDSATPGQGTCTQSSGTVTCSLGTLTSGQTVSIDIGVHPQNQGTWTNNATISSDVADPHGSDNSPSASTTVVTPNFVRPKGASPFRMALVPAYQACSSPNSSHGLPFDSPSCKPPTQASNFLTGGSPDANGAGANGVGYVLLKTQINPTPTPNDVLITASVTDVRCKSGVATCGLANAADGPDYTGQLQATYSLRLTDRFNDPTATTPGTVTQTSFPVTVPCTATAAASIGSDCTLTTSANSVMPGSARSGDRAVWQIGQVQVLDGGPDGLASTQNNTVFQTQGVFVP